MQQISAHRFFRPVIAGFLIFVVLQLLSGALLYVWKPGLDSARTIEYYYGSERMLEIFPGRPDRFLQPRTYSGLVKITLGHFLAYGTLVFILTHLVRSLVGRPSARLERACFAYFAIALIEIFSGFLLLVAPRNWVAAQPELIAALRAGIFVLFTAMSLFFVGLLAYLARGRAVAAGGSAHPARGKLPSLMVLLTLLVGGVSAGCQSLTTGYTIETHRGDTERVVRMSGNYLGGAFSVPGTLSVYSAQLNLQKTELDSTEPGITNNSANGSAKNSTVVISFYGRFIDLDAIQIPEGPTLTLELDGTTFEFSGAGSEKLRGTYGDGLFQETAYWHQIPPEALIALYQAKVVRIRVRGANRELSYFATDKNRSNFRRFIRDELPEIFARAQL